MDETAAAEIRRIRTRLEIGAMDAHEAVQCLGAWLAKFATVTDTAPSAVVSPEKMEALYGR